RAGDGTRSEQALAARDTMRAARERWQQAWHRLREPHGIALDGTQPVVVPPSLTGQQAAALLPLLTEAATRLRAFAREVANVEALVGLPKVAQPPAPGADAAKDWFTNVWRVLSEEVAQVRATMRDRLP